MKILPGINLCNVMACCRVMVLRPFVWRLIFKMCILLVLLCRWHLWLMGLLEGRDMASFPHIKEDSPDWAAAATHEGGLSNSSRASRGAKQEDAVKKQRVQRAKSLKKAALLGAERAKSLKKSSTCGCREGKIPLKTAVLGAESAVERATSLENNIFGCNEGKERATSLEK